MSVNIATMGMFKECCGTGTGGGAPPVYQYEARGEEPPIHVDVIRVRSRKSKKVKKITINVENVRSERKV